MLIQGFLNEVTGICLILALLSRFFVHGDLMRYVSVSTIFMIALVFFTFTCVWALMYRQQFTPKQVKLHEKIES